MRLSILNSSLLVLLLLNGSPAVGADKEQAERRPVITPELVAAHHTLQLARLRVHEYQFVTLPAARRALDSQKRLAQAEIQILRGRLRDYRPFLRVGEYSAVRTVAESHQLSLLAAEGQLRQLQDERIALMRSSRQQYTLHNLEVLRAAARLAQLRRELVVEQQP